MGTDHKMKILSTLLDWYESSPAYIRGQKPSRRRIMRLYDGGETDFPAYNIEDPSVRKDINQAVLDLSDKGLIEFKWMKEQKNHFIAQLWLNVDAVEQVYAWLGRQPRGDAVDNFLSQLTGLLNRTRADWVRSWLEDTIAIISRKRSIGSVMPENPLERDDLLKAVSYAADNAEIETLERVFSIRCFGDSKRFERAVKPRLTRIIKKYLARYNCTDDCTDEEALRLIGIVPYPEQFAFSGELSIILPKGVLDFAPLPFGGTLTIDDIKQGKLVIAQSVRRVLSVENLANYVDYVHRSQKSGELVFFHGGQFSPAKRLFLKAIVFSLSDSCEFFHWGDIDYGGFLMLARLRREIFPAVKPWRMDKSELAQYAEFTIGFSDAYGRRLASLLDIPELSDCYPSIEYMIEKGVRLEQEAMLTGL